MKLNMRETTASAMPTVDNTMKITVREISTVSIISLGLPSYGMPPKECDQQENNLDKRFFFPSIHLTAP